MAIIYQARWISKSRRDALRRSPEKKGVVLDLLGQSVVVEPAGSQLGDGPVLSPGEADYELRAAWCLDGKSRLAEARRRLGLRPESEAAAQPIMG